MSTPVEKISESIGHDCQTGCGSRADVVLVQLATGEADVMCQPCLVAMMTAAIAELAGTAAAEGGVPGDSGVEAAMEAARAALAAE